MAYTWNAHTQRQINCFSVREITVKSLPWYFYAHFSTFYSLLSVYRLELPFDDQYFLATNEHISSVYDTRNYHGTRDCVILP